MYLCSALELCSAIQDMPWLWPAMGQGPELCGAMCTLWDIHGYGKLCSPHCHYPCYPVLAATAEAGSYIAAICSNVSDFFLMFQPTWTLDVSSVLKQRPKWESRRSSDWVGKCIMNMSINPKFGWEADRTWKSEMVLDQCDHFFINNFTDHLTYQTIY